jgi:hypothetical protein
MAAPGKYQRLRLIYRMIGGKVLSVLPADTSSEMSDEECFAQSGAIYG